MKKKMKKKVIMWLWLFSFLLLLPCGSVKASGVLTPAAVDNLTTNLRRSSDLVSTKDGYMRVYYNAGRVGIEYYDNAFRILSKKSLLMELPTWGGFYAGADAYYLVEGQSNTAESDTAEVIRVIKYSLDWRKLGAAKITGNPELFGGKVRYPFHAGCVEMTEVNGTLYVVTGHEGYVDPLYNQGHQGFLMIAVDETSMTGEIVASNLGHSFAQYIKSRGNDLYVLEQSEGARCTTLSKYDSKTMSKERFSVLDYGGERTSAWAISCYASVDGMAVSDETVLCVGTSIDQSQYENVTSDMSHNIYLTVTPMGDFTKEATTLKWLTNYQGDGKAFLGLKITKINDDRFLITWEEQKGEDEEEILSNLEDSLSCNTLHYIYVDKQGNQIGEKMTTAFTISDCQPIVKNDKVSFVSSSANTTNFYSIDASTGETETVSYHSVGENASWDLHNGVLTISGTGAVDIDIEARYRYPLSSAGNLFLYSSSDNCWKQIRKQVKKIVVRSGITSICDGAFQQFTNLEEVEFEPGLKSIGKEVFFGCSRYSLKKITIPASVTEIGEDILWTGYSYLDENRTHVTCGVIYTTQDSAAHTYAKKNHVPYIIDLSDGKISGLDQSYVSLGKAIKPKITVTLGKCTLEENTDYSVSYKKNTKPGTASVVITGIDHYEGELKKTFEIILPPKNYELTDSAKNVYKVTKQGSTVAFVKAADKTKALWEIPETVKLKGVTYQVTAIAGKAFYKNRTVRKVVIPKNVTSIGSYAFMGCTSLHTVKISSTVKTIGTKAFYGCKALTSVTIGSNVTTIKSSAFEKCTALKKLTIPAKVTKLGDKVLAGCTSLRTLVIRSTGLTSDGMGAKVFYEAGKNDYSKLNVTVPAKKYKSYKKLFGQRGLSSKASVKKQ